MMKQWEKFRPTLGSRHLVVIAACLVVSAASAPPARAGNLDRALLDKAPEILKELVKKKYRNVGVLPFKVQKARQRASYTAAPLAVNLPGRLENALILSMSPDSVTPLGIIRDAAGVANRAGIGSWANSSLSYRALFKTRYPLAWGKDRVQADAFLTGLVSRDGEKTTVTVELFDKDSRAGRDVRMQKVAEFTVATDRPLLRDLGHGYALARSALGRGVTARQRDTWALEMVEEEQDNTKPGQGQGPRPTPANIAGMAFDIRYNGRKQTIRPLSPGSPGSREWQIDPVKEGTKVTMALTRVLREERRLGVVLKVNGRSTFGMQQDDSLRCTKWLYDVKTHLGKADVFEGFYTDTAGKNLRRFRVLTAEESQEMAEELGEKAGWIDIDVYASGEGTTREDTDVDEVMVTTRGRAQATEKPASLAALREQLARANNVRLPQIAGRSVGGGLIVHKLLSEKGPPILKDKLPNPIHLGGITIKYWDRAGTAKRID